ncbi:hypothetical protein KYC5002_40640 [Archangium violaceum]|nr:hypothetical protein KYC5002_40640 [Archangium gephyra]
MSAFLVDGNDIRERMDSARTQGRQCIHRANDLHTQPGENPWDVPTPRPR